MLYDITKYAVGKIDDKIIYTPIVLPPLTRVYYRTCLDAQIKADKEDETTENVCSRFKKISKDEYIKYIIAVPNVIKAIHPTKSLSYQLKKSTTYSIVYYWDEFWEDVYV